VKKREVVKAQEEVEERQRQLEAAQRKRMEERTLEHIQDEAKAMKRRQFICIAFVVAFCVALYFFIRIKISVKREYVFN
jgi:uncharacterized membrane protein (DUF106 family)